ncbi:MAG: T9SS type A sorting domain-containing protein, partial [Flavobacteriales bacterium]|nr:T9SS type A sorting domain-containing protein [Flavobacteriales bacterium]
KTVEIYDVTGRVILSIVDINSKEQLIEEGNLNEGLYFIRISTESSYSVETVMFE